MSNIKREAYFKILKSIGCYESFCLNLVNHYLTNNIDPKEVTNFKSFYDFVKTSFDNKQTEEGEYYWHMVASKRITPPIMPLDILCIDKFGYITTAHFNIPLN